MTVVIQTYVSSKIHFPSVEWSSTGSAPWDDGSLNVSFRSLEEWIDILNAVIDDVDYACIYDPDTNETTIYRTVPGTDYGFQFSAQWVADLLGYASPTTTGLKTPAETHVSTEPPNGVIPLLGWSVDTGRPARDPDIAEYRHGRVGRSSWSGGTLYDATIEMSDEHLDTFFGGPCSQGRVLIGEWLGEETRLDGYIHSIGSVQRVGSVDGGSHYVIPLTVYVPAEDYDTGLGYPFSTPEELISYNRYVGWPFASARKHPIAYAILIEGIPFHFCEMELSAEWIESNYSQSPRLIIDKATNLAFRFDRTSGVVASQPIDLGILDPDNELGLFGRPTKSTTLTADVGAADTTINVVDTSDFDSSGQFYLGKELIRYTGKTSTSFTGCTRGVCGYAYAHPAQGGQGITVSDRPTIWGGRIVSLQSIILDPGGYPSEEGWSSLKVNRIASFEIASPPGYIGGVWNLRCTDLLRRLTRGYGYAGKGRIANSTSASALFGSVVSDLIVYTPSTAVINWSWAGTYGGASPYADDVGVSGSIDFTTAIAAYGGVTADAVTGGYLSHLTQTLNAVVAAVLSQSDGGSETIGQKVSIAVTGVKVEDDVIVFHGVQTRISDSVENAKNMTLSITVPGAYWAGSGAKFYVVDDGTNTITWDLKTNVGGEKVLAVGVREDAGYPAWASSGTIIVKTDDDQPEGIKYAHKATFAGRTVFYGLTRASSGARANLLEEGLEVVEGLALTGPIGEQILTLLQSSGTGLRGDYDIENTGYGLDDSLMYEPSFEEFTSTFSPQLRIGPGDSLAEQLRGVLLMSNRALGWVVGRIGLVPTVPTIDKFRTVGIRDAHLRLANEAITLESLTYGPNVIKIENGDADNGGEITVQARADVANRGVDEMSLAMHGVPAAIFESIATQLGLSVVSRVGSDIAYRLKTAPLMLYCGTSVDMVIENPGVFDIANGVRGLTASGVVAESRINLKTLESEAVIVTGGGVTVAPLAPVSTVVSSTSSTMTLSDAYALIDSESDDPPATVAVYRPGTDEYEILNVDSWDLDTLTITITGSFATAPTDGESVVTVPYDGAGEEWQERFAHIQTSDPWV